MSIRLRIQESLFKALLRLGAGKVVFSLTNPENIAHGDWATNAALVSTKVLLRSPMDIAAQLAVELEKDADLKKYLEKIEVVRPGFINFFLLPAFLQKSVGEIVKQKNAYGQGKKTKESVNIEFISANPTGPLTLANGRGGFFGDVLGNVLQFAGRDVTKEYYINDAGNQIKTLGNSVLARAGLIPSADEHYQGDYIASYAKEFADELPKFLHDPEALGKIVADAMLAREIQPVIKRAGIRFDVWTSEEKDIRAKGLVVKTLKTLHEKSFTYEKDGAVWLASSKFGDTEDRVLVKSVSKDFTYIAVDIPYHVAKWKRGYTKLVNIWGADHHGDVARLQAGMQMMEKPPVDILLLQLVRLVENGKEVRMSKRTGNFVTLAELFDEVGIDVARFFFLMRELSTHMDFDLALAKEKSDKNPVFYVQYAHARIAGVLRNAKVRRGGRAKPNFLRLTKPEELALIKKLLHFPELIEDVAKTYEVHRLGQYAMELAATFHKFYDTTRILDADKGVSAARLALAESVQVVLGNALRLMGISTPDRM